MVSRGFEIGSCLLKSTQKKYTSYALRGREKEKEKRKEKNLEGALLFLYIQLSGDFYGKKVSPLLRIKFFNGNRGADKCTHEIN